MSQKILHRPPILQKGDAVSIVAPASFFDREIFEEALKQIKSWGFRPKYRQDIFSKQRYLAGSDSRRAEELIQALKDPETKAVFLARGGYGCSRLLPYLDQLEERPPPKIVVGYSDATVLLNYLHQAWSWVTFHGPVLVKDIARTLRSAGKASLFQNLLKNQALGEIKPATLEVLHPGHAQGKLIGGCLSLIAHTVGTPYQLKTQGCILYLEDVDEALYRLDRMLTQLRYAGLFKDLQGIVLGPFKGCHEDPACLKDFLKEQFVDFKGPILWGFPSGHCEDTWTLPLGVEIEIKNGALFFCKSALED
ncbi:MAG: LD-carboxypeptidase [Deltaproteobacteria bacterium]|nr:LD-carboxypeptidase [Deltaproteobacteria bacterium]